MRRYTRLERPDLRTFEANSFPWTHLSHATVLVAFFQF